MTEYDDFRAGQLCAVDDGSVVQLVGEKHVSRTDECGNDPDVGHVARIESEGGLGFEKGRQF